MSLRAATSGRWGVPGWTAAAALLLAAAGLAGPAGASVRVGFVLGCAVVGWYAWRRGPAHHLQAALILFAFTPLARRLADLAHGYDTVGLMLVGPLAALVAPAVERVYSAQCSRRSGGVLPAAVLIVGCCVLYAASLSFLQGEVTVAASGVIKWGAPLLYALLLYGQRDADADELVRAATRAFTIILPAVGLYGVWQYVDPPAWDRFWLLNAPITSAGLPRPFMVRTFATMNGPASFATFTAVGILLVCFTRLGPTALLAAAPAVLALLLSSYRTAWISLAVGILFCSAFASTRSRALVIAGAGVAAVFAAGILTPFGAVIFERLSTFESAAEDSSGRERLAQLDALWHQPDTLNALFGVGFTAATDGSSRQMPIDGMIVGCWVAMGFLIGAICLATLVWLAVHAARTAARTPTRESVVLGALAAGGLVQLPLANISSGELGFLFWTFAALATMHRTPPAEVPANFFRRRLPLRPGWNGPTGASRRQVGS